MKATYTVRPGLSVEVEAPTQKQLFEELASAAEVFGELGCACCGGTDLAPYYRHVTQGKATFEYPEWRCLNPQCDARLSLGTTMEGGRLFPIRQLDAQGRASRKHGTHGEHRGWTKFKGAAADDGETTAPAAAATRTTAPPSHERPTPQTPPEGTRRPPVTDTAPPQSWPGTRDATPPPAQDARTDYTPPQGTAPPTVGHHITPAQWAQIHDALQKHGVCDNAFLERHTYGSPRDILVAHFPEALAAAVSPDKATREIDQAIKRGRRQTSNGVR
jgi:hypothetical protein